VDATAVDATGLESPHTFQYFVQRSSTDSSARTYTKLTVACDIASHFIAGAALTTGPSNDSPQFQPVMTLAALPVAWDRVQADAASDSESHHAYARNDLGVRPTVIPVNARGHEGPPSGWYRDKMSRRFRPRPEDRRHKRVFGHRPPGRAEGT